MKTYTYKEVIRPTIPEKILVQTQCDLCKEVHVNEWRENGYDAVETEVRLKTGKHYPDCGYGKETTIDICPDCFTNKLIPWVEAQGGEPTVEDWEV